MSDATSKLIPTVEKARPAPSGVAVSMGPAEPGGGSSPAASPAFEASPAPAEPGPASEPSAGVIPWGVTFGPSGWTHSSRPVPSRVGAGELAEAVGTPGTGDGPDSMPPIMGGSPEGDAPARPSPKWLTVRQLLEMLLGPEPRWLGSLQETYPDLSLDTELPGFTADGAPAGGVPAADPESQSSPLDDLSRRLRRVYAGEGDPLDNLPVGDAARSAAMMVMGLPADAKRVGATWDDARHCWLVTLRSATFPPVPLGDVVPMLGGPAPESSDALPHPTGGCVPLDFDGPGLPWVLIGGDDTPGRWLAVQGDGRAGADANSAEFTGAEAEHFARLFVDLANASPMAIVRGANGLLRALAEHGGLGPIGPGVAS